MEVLSLSLSLSLVIYHSAEGLAWPSSLFCVDDSEGQWQSGALAQHSVCVFSVCVCVCENPHLSIGSAVLRCQERLCDLCVTEGVFHRSEWEPQGERHILCICLWVHVCGLWNFIIKPVKTTHCVCFNMSVWLLPQGWHSQVTVLLKNVIVPVIL